jgi:hypothetical protein
VEGLYVATEPCLRLARVADAMVGASAAVAQS